MSKVTDISYKLLEKIEAGNSRSSKNVGVFFVERANNGSSKVAQSKCFMVSDGVSWLSTGHYINQHYGLVASN